MLVQNEVEVQAILKGSAAKVLLHLLAHRGETQSNAEIMRGSGVHDRNTYFAAKKQLQEYGLWENPYAIVGENPTVGGNTQTVGGIIPTVGGNIPTPEVMSLLRGRVKASLSATVIPGPEPVPEPEVESMDHRKLCMQVDLLDQSGDPMRRDSPFQERRRRQIEAIRFAFSDLFNGRMLTVEAAKRWLVLTDDSAEEVFDTIEYTQVHKGSQMESPIAYIERVLKNKKEERKKDASVRPASLEAPQSEPDYYLKENSPRTKMVKDKLRSLGIRFAGDGLGPMPEEDD